MKKRLLAFLTACTLLLVFAAFAEMETEADERRRALLVGCDDFIMHEDTLPSAQMNVRRMQEVLQTDVRGYDSIYTYQTGFAGKDQLLSAIAGAFGQADADDVSLLYLCTHGLYDRITFEPSLVISDGTTENPLMASELRSALDSIPGQKIILLDACNSGAFIGKGEWDDQMKNWFAGPDYIVLTSAGASENSFLWRNNQQAGGSYFADCLSEGLRTRSFDLDGDGIITVQEAYKGILEDHGASTAHCYPQVSSYPLFMYDPAEESAGERPVSGITLDAAVLTGGEDTLYFSFTVHRPVRIQYQLIYYKDGFWRFDKPQNIWDEESGNGVVLPGRKERSITIVSEDGEPTGYVLLQIIATEGRRSMLAGSRLIAVQPSMADPQLEISVFSMFAPREGEELAVRVAHAVPCSLSAVVRDMEGKAVRRLAYREASRPIRLEHEGSIFYWDGKDNAGEYVPPGDYYVEISCKMDDFTYYENSETITID